MESKLLICAAITAVVLVTGCATTGNKNLDPTSMVVVTTERPVTIEEFTARFGEPLATKELESHTLLGYRKRDVKMNAWSLVPFVGLVAGGVDEDFTTCLAKVSKPTRLVESVSCSTERNFQSNAETAVGDRVSEKEFQDIFGAPLKK